MELDEDAPKDYNPGRRRGSVGLRCGLTSEFHLTRHTIGLRFIIWR